MSEISTYLELRRARWMEKLAHMKKNRFPRLLLGAWIPHARRNGKSGRAQQSIRHAYACTLKKLGYTEDKDFSFKTWMTHARDRNIWSKRVEYFLSLPKGAYSRKNANHQAAELQNFSDPDDT